jgi:hypothetical protein
MKMREYVDEIQGKGSWDRMHDLIDKKELLGWRMPPVVVDDKLVHIFPGTNREVTLEEVKNEIRNSLERSRKVESAPRSGMPPIDVREFLNNLKSEPSK